MPKLAIAIDLGGTLARAALVDRSGKILKRASVPTAAKIGPPVVMEQLIGLAREVSADVPRAALAGAGVSSPGPLDADRGVTYKLPTIEGFLDFPIVQTLHDALQVPVALENDGLAAALGEWRHGAGRGRNHFVYVTVSTGIGGGIVCDGRMLRGRMGMAGHIGHMIIVRDGDVCGCGNPGCWEAYASGTSFARRARARAAGAATSLGANGAEIDARAVFAAAEKGDALAKELVAEQADFLGIGMVSLAHLYSPELIIMGGGVASNFELLLPGILARFQRDAMPAFREIEFVRAELGENSGLIGAGMLAFDRADAAKKSELASD